MPKITNSQSEDHGSMTERSIVSTSDPLNKIRGLFAERFKSRNNSPSLVIGIIGLICGPILIWPFPEPIQIPGVVVTRDDDTVSTGYAGKIDKIYDYDGKFIKKGYPIIEIDSTQYREDAINSKARLAALRRDVACVLNGVENLNYTPINNNTPFVRKVIADISDGIPLGFDLACKDYSDSSVAILEAKIKEKSATVSRLEGIVRDFRAELAVQIKQLQRYERAAAQGLISRLQVLQAEREYLKSKKEYNDSLASIPVAKDQLAQANSALVSKKSELMMRFQDMLNQSMTNFAVEFERSKVYENIDSLTAINDVGNYVIKARRDGVVSGEFNYREGDYVGVGQVIANIISPDAAMYVVAQAGTNDRKKISIGSGSVVSFNSPTTGGTVNIDGHVSQVSLISEALFHRQQEVQTGRSREALYPIDIRLSNLGSEIDSDLRAQLIAGESVSVTIEGPITNLLLTFIRPLRLSSVVNSLKRVVSNGEHP